MKELHVIFGTGPLGRWTADALLKKGKSVRMINRTGKMMDPLDGVEIISSDAYDVSKNIELTRDSTAIYQCAQPHYYEWVDKFPSLQNAILDAAIANRSRMVVGDNLYMYGHFSGPLTEDFPINPNTRKGKVRAEMAQEIMNAHSSGKVQAVIGRASDFFGPYDTAFTGYAIEPAVKGKTVNLLGNVDQPHSFTYIKDFGMLLAELGTNDSGLGQVWFAPTNPPITQAEFLKLIESEFGKPVKSMVGGPLMMRMIGLFNKEIAETVEMMFEWMNPYVINSSKAEKTFGLKTTPFSQAMQETIEYLKKRKMSNQ
ncbi:MAG: NAD-dependent dehydratase [Chloroflexi bacterium HGW-Chloroflexi-3]|nr:MAG: NAD-dependent dehydratase [Chloroflexi bacterium HGW-Chloroflexi-3]